jgi:putative transposase
LNPSKYHAWQHKQGQENRHNAAIPRSSWLLLWEKAEIIRFATANPDEGYRRLAYRMLDLDYVAVSPSSVYRVLKEADLLRELAASSSQKGQGFEQPQQPHEHWHIDVSHINIAGTFYYLYSILDGYSRFIVHWGLRDSMTEQTIEVILAGAKERYPEAKPRIISDNGP